jgi:hypothetical protein
MLLWQAIDTFAIAIQLMLLWQVIDTTGPCAFATNAALAGKTYYPCAFAM